MRDKLSTVKGMFIGGILGIILWAMIISCGIWALSTDVKANEQTANDYLIEYITCQDVPGITKVTG